MDDVVLDLKNFDKMTKKMQADLQKHYAKVGVLAEKNARIDDNDYITNAGLAAVHEFGVVEQNIPSRSFFRLTQEKRGQDLMAFINDQADNIFKRVMAGQTKYVLGRIASLWSDYIHECFETEGFGTWAQLSETTIENRREKTPKKSAGDFDPKILQDTGQLERSITFEVK